MARNEEKAAGLMNRWVSTKQMLRLGVKKYLLFSIYEIRERPTIPSQVNNIAECERWRTQVLTEISRNITKIQDTLLPETTIRDLNDEINKQLKEKFFWEKQILDLGGPNYILESKRLEANEKKYQIGNYRYFGAARQLPGVKELFEEEEIKPQRRSRYDMYKCISCDYYGYRDEDDGVILEKEAEAERIAIEKEVAIYRKDEENRKLEKKRAIESGAIVESEEDADDIDENNFVISLNGFVAIPSQKDINEIMKKRREVFEEEESNTNNKNNTNEN